MSTLTCPHCDHTADEDEWEFDVEDFDSDSAYDAYCPECGEAFHGVDGEED